MAMTAIPAEYRTMLAALHRRAMEEAPGEGATLARVPGGFGSDSDEPAAAWLAGVFDFAWDVLEELRADGGDPSPVRHWPEHFDVAIEAGDEAAGLRANYGVSPGDERHDEPYLYVGPWTARPAGPEWNAVGFPGAELRWSELAAQPDPRAAALAFFRARRAGLVNGR